MLIVNVITCVFRVKKKNSHLERISVELLVFVRISIFTMALELQEGLSFTTVGKLSGYYAAATYRLQLLLIKLASGWHVITWV